MFAVQAKRKFKFKQFSDSRTRYMIHDDDDYSDCKGIKHSVEWRLFR